jgi:FMN phosphatase YigB (HAD superfamily)
MKMGKQQHMASVAEELMTKPALGVMDVNKQTTLLIDDDPKNISMCLKDGARAVWFNPLDPDRLLDDILKLR